ncbi:MAG: hypothetical protein K5853_08555 [Lachnospiraceae bacterium]|nr:hypothetical protein [Lachnospiraceae bacterium]
MGLSASSLNPISKVSHRVTVPQAYTVENQSEVSDAFTEALKTTGANSVMAAPPVQYATATITTNRINQLEKNQEANRAYNDLAASFEGISTAYDQSSAATNYSMVGSRLDLFA